MSRKSYKNRFKNSKLISGKVKKKQGLVDDLDKKINEEIEKQKEFIDLNKNELASGLNILLIN